MQLLARDRRREPSADSRASVERSRNRAVPHTLPNGIAVRAAGHEDPEVVFVWLKLPLTRLTCRGGEQLRSRRLEQLLREDVVASSGVWTTTDVARLACRPWHGVPVSQPVLVVGSHTARSATSCTAGEEPRSESRWCRTRGATVARR